jgi:hypothetical protein
MSPTIAEIAESLSRHPSLRGDVSIHARGPRMDAGETHVRGNDEIVALCEESAEYLAGVRTTFHRFKLIEADDCVVIDSRAEYVDGDGGSSTVASLGYLRLRRREARRDHLLHG